MRQIGTALAAEKPRVRAGSVPVGTERGWWRPMARAEGLRLIQAARRYELATRRKGARNGALGHVALEALALLCNLADRRTGRLDPALAFLMRRLKRSKAAIVRALAALKAHGFLDWLRRTKPTGHVGKGPQLRQASNAYRLTLPALAARMLPAPPPAPDIDRPEPVRSEASQALLDLLSDMAAQRGFTVRTGV